MDSTERCLNCGLPLQTGATHSCVAAMAHDPACSCVYCHQEHRFAASPAEPVLTADEAEAQRLESLIADWRVAFDSLPKAKGKTADSLCLQMWAAQARLGDYITERAKRKFIQREFRKNLRLKNLYTEVCREYSWLDDFERAMRLGQAAMTSS